MLLKSIKLENFRQFRNESIDFAQGEGGKNVTIIIGENGTGKTTFAQAFFWCLYGETEFSDKIILNKMVATEMTPGSEERVRVTLALRHGEVDYTLIRGQAYRKDYSNKVKGDNTVFDIAVKDARAIVWCHSGENPSDRGKSYKKTFKSYKKEKIGGLSVVGTGKYCSFSKRKAKL